MSPPLTDLQTQWNELYKTRLPSLAKQKDAAQPKWPVTLDHCFARIILDNTVGQGEQPWTNVLKAPAYKNMDGEQLRAAIQLGESIATGKADLVELDEQSLLARGKASKVATRGIKRKASNEVKAEPTSPHKDDSQSKPPPPHEPNKRRKQDSTLSSYFASSPAKQVKERVPATSPVTSSSASPTAAAKPSSATPTDDEVAEAAALVHSATHLSLFRRRVLLALLQVPRGRHTTYAALAKHLGATSPDGGKTCARAVGSAMRNNPFAPVVPCHRVLASDGRIGGFGGEWGAEGRHAGEKVRLLREEGVGFDGKGKVLGRVFTEYR